MVSLARAYGFDIETARSFVRVVKQLGHPVLSIKSAMYANRFLESVRDFPQISVKTGYRDLRGITIPELPPAIDACERIFKSRGGGDLDDPRTKALIAGSKKAHLIDLLDEEYLHAEPAIMNLALSDQVLAAVTDYMGTLPKLHSVQCWWTHGSHKDHKSSQRFHLDRNDLKQVRFLINITDVGPNDGAFSFLPADVTAEVLSYTGGGYPGPLADEQVFGICDQSKLVAYEAPKGSMAVVDTARCLHFGSRSTGGQRLLLTFCFTTHHASQEAGRPVPKSVSDGYAGDAVRSLVTHC